MKREEIREALKRDFRKLYVKEFTTNWETVRLIREVEIDVMSLDNLYALLPKPQQPEQEVCQICGGEGKLFQYDDGQRQEIGCDYCHGTGKAGLSLGEVWERYQQGRLVELDDYQSLPAYSHDNYMLIGDNGRQDWDDWIKRVYKIHQDMLIDGWMKVKRVKP